MLPYAELPKDIRDEHPDQSRICDIRSTPTGYKIVLNDGTSSTGITRMCFFCGLLSSTPRSPPVHRLKFEDIPNRIQATYPGGVVVAAGSDRHIKGKVPPSEFYVFLANGSRDIWRWPSDEHSGGWYKAESDLWVPDAAMQARIVQMFYRTWDAVGADIQQSLRQQDDRWARKVLSRGVLTQKEAYETIIDHVDSHHGDDEAFDAWTLWHTADYDTSRKAVGSRLKGIGF